MMRFSRESSDGTGALTWTPAYGRWAHTGTPISVLLMPETTSLFRRTCNKIKQLGDVDIFLLMPTFGISDTMRPE